MTVTDQLKIIDNKIKANQVQYDLDRLAAKISANSFGELRKYEYKFTPIKSKQNCFQSKNRLQTRIVISRNNKTIRECRNRC